MSVELDNDNRRRCNRDVRLDLPLDEAQAFLRMLQGSVDEAYRRAKAAHKAVKAAGFVVVLVLVLASCGAASGTLEPVGVVPVSLGQPAPSVADLGCVCCWPEAVHGPGRCMLARASSAPPGACEAEPAYRCPGVQDGGLP